MVQESDFGDYYQLYDGSFECSKINTYYPPRAIDITVYSDTQTLPMDVRKIYKETISAFQNGDFILTGIGLRATLEAVCLDQDVTDEELSSKINTLNTRGVISKIDCSHLHAIRFMGNDAAHRTDAPERSDLKVALEIINHLLIGVYKLNKETYSKRYKHISNYTEFKVELESSLQGLECGRKYSLKKILGNNHQRIKATDIEIFEGLLIGEINSGNMAELEFFSEKDKNLYLIKQTEQIADTSVDMASSSVIANTDAAPAPSTKA
jgi:hypothetical protein